MRPAWNKNLASEKRRKRRRRWRIRLAKYFHSDATKQLDSRIKICIQSFNAGRVDLRSDEFYHVTLHSFILRQIHHMTSSIWGMSPNQTNLQLRTCTVIGSIATKRLKWGSVPAGSKIANGVKVWWLEHLLVEQEDPVSFPALSKCVSFSFIWFIRKNQDPVNLKL